MDNNENNDRPTTPTLIVEDDEEEENNNENDINNNNEDQHKITQLTLDEEDHEQNDENNNANNNNNNGTNVASSSSSTTTTTTQTGGGKIKRLSEDVVNRIAAGEVIHKPANALKEMIENSIDAKSTSITIQVKDGGMKMLEISDDGHGIRQEDMALVCERFTTSKLSSFEDLRSINTYGFRGEALASISHVAHLQITSMTRDSPCAFKASYKDGKIEGNPKPCSGVVGTRITVEDLFYNVMTRRLAIKSAHEEYQRILDIVTKYAVHNNKISFNCKKRDTSVADICTTGNQPVESVIRTLYGDNVARELVHVTHESGSDENNFGRSLLAFSMDAYVTKANYHIKKTTFILFINHRLVDSKNLKSALESVYSKYLPKGTHPFIYLSLIFPPQHLDVNVHPTKSEVRFLNEERVIDVIKQTIEEKLLTTNNSRNLEVPSIAQTTPILTPINSTQRGAQSKDTTLPSSTQKTNIPRQDRLVRNDPKEQFIDAFMVPIPKSSSRNEDDENEVGIKRSSNTTDSDEPSKKAKRSSDEETTPPRKYKPCQLTSVQNIVQDLERGKHPGLYDIFKDCTLVGCVDGVFSLVQHRTKLYGINVPNISKEIFYQEIFARFGNFDKIRLSSSLPLADMIQVALESSMNEPGTDWSMSAKNHATALAERYQMLDEYFSIEIDPKTHSLSALPQIIDNFIPQMEFLPHFLLNLATKVEWEFETECFTSLAKELSEFYSIHPDFDNFENENLDSDSEQSLGWKIHNLIYPVFRKNFRPPKNFSNDGTVIQVASLENLYKIFERC